MQTQAQFRSNLFPAYDGEEEVTNPNLWGKRLGEYLHEHLRAEGVETEELVPEDWGWCLPVKNDAFRLWIGCGHSAEHENAYRCFVEPAKPTVRSGLKKVDTTQRVGQVVAALIKVLTSDPEITDVVWSEAND